MSSEEMYVLSGTDGGGNPVELIAPKGTMVSVVVCRECRTPIRDGGCPQCEQP